MTCISGILNYVGIVYQFFSNSQNSYYGTTGFEKLDREIGVTYYDELELPKTKREVKKLVKVLLNGMVMAHPSIRVRASQLLLDLLRNLKPSLLKKELYQLKVFICQRMKYERCPPVNLNLLMLLIRTNNLLKYLNQSTRSNEELVEDQYTKLAREDNKIEIQNEILVESRFGKAPILELADNWTLETGKYKPYRVTEEYSSESVLHIKSIKKECEAQLKIREAEPSTYRFAPNGCTELWRSTISESNDGVMPIYAISNSSLHMLKSVTSTLSLTLSETPSLLEQDILESDCDHVKEYLESITSLSYCSSIDEDKAITDIDELSIGCQSITLSINSESEDDTEKVEDDVITDIDNLSIDSKSLNLSSYSILEGDIQIRKVRSRDILLSNNKIKTNKGKNTPKSESQLIEKNTCDADLIKTTKYSDGIVGDHMYQPIIQGCKIKEVEATDLTNKLSIFKLETNTILSDMGDKI